MSFEIRNTQNSTDEQVSSTVRPLETANLPIVTGSVLSPTSNGEWERYLDLGSAAAKHTSSTKPSNSQANDEVQQTDVAIAIADILETSFENCSLSGSPKILSPMSAFYDNMPKPVFTYPVWGEESNSEASGGLNGDGVNQNVGSSAIDPVLLDMSYQTVIYDPSNSYLAPLGYGQHVNYNYPDPTQDPMGPRKSPYYMDDVPQQDVRNYGPVQPRMQQQPYYSEFHHGNVISGSYGVGPRYIPQPLYSQPNGTFVPQHYAYPRGSYSQQAQAYHPMIAPQADMYQQQPQLYQPFPGPPQPLMQPTYQQGLYNGFPIPSQQPNLDTLSGPVFFDGMPITTGGLPATTTTLPETPKNVYKERLRKGKQSLREVNAETDNDDAQEDNDSEYKSDGSAYSDAEPANQKYGRRRRHIPTTNTPGPSRTCSTVNFPKEKPAPVPDKPWVRKNNTTLGKTSRTGKINRFVPDYQDVAPPFVPWKSSSGFVFQYDQWGGLHQPTRGRDNQSKVSYTTQAIKEFIYEHPEDLERNQKLVLWIQQVPADSTRRYPTEHGHSCRFDDCPEKAFKRNIRSGYYQVAFDEKWTSHAEATDPFHVAGYVHLYCLERFLDFPDICARFDVRVDGRQTYAGEYKNEFGGSLQRKNTRGDEYSIAWNFIQACKQGSFPQEYPDYPIHAHTRPGARKNHRQTLTYAMTDEKNSFNTQSKVNVTKRRGLKTSFIEVNYGDLQERVDYMLGHKQQRRKTKGLEDVAEEAEGEAVSGAAKSRKRNARTEAEEEEEEENVGGRPMKKRQLRVRGTRRTREDES